MSEPDPPGQGAGPSSQAFDETLDVPGGGLTSLPPFTGSWRLGRFEVRGELGRGGMGRVLDAWDPELGRSVAVKVLLTPDPQAEERMARFVAEAQITSQLEHPNIVPVHDIGSTASGEIYFVMKRVEGTSLRDLVAMLRSGRAERSRWSRQRLLRVFVHIAQAVAYAHERGVLHRDLKPSNVMLGAFGEVLLMDWGLARTFDAPLGDASQPPISPTRAGDTQLGSAMGTPGYMAPEQAEGLTPLVDTRSDIWSLGAILFELLTLQRAFKDNVHLASVTGGRVPMPDAREVGGESVPEGLAAICRKAMAPRRSARFLSVGELVDAVEAWLEGSARRREAEGRLERARGSWRRLQKLEKEQGELALLAERLSAVVEPWSPVEHPAKAQILAAQARQEELHGEIAGELNQVLSAAEGALTVDAGHADARELLATVYWSRFERAERRGDGASAAYYRGRVAEFGDAAWADRLDGQGTLSFATVPAGVEVLLQTVHKRGLVWRAGTGIPLGAAPMTDVSLPMGSHLLTLSAPGRPPVTYPVSIERGGHWRGGTVFVPPGDLVPEGFRYVPAGPFRVGGDPGVSRCLPAATPWVGGVAVAEHPVTIGEYLEFLAALWREDPAVARARAPRSGSEPDAPCLLGEPDPERGFLLPREDAQGHEWQAGWPVVSINWHDAMAYAAWRAQGSGLPLRLPEELEWAKAARGVDGRAFPWGDQFDATLCKMAQSRRGPPEPEPVGSFAADRSVYGVRDVAGTVREWCGDPTFDGEPLLRPVRGGAWSGTARISRLANRYGFNRAAVHTYLGFRLALSVGSPPPEEVEHA